MQLHNFCMSEKPMTPEEPGLALTDLPDPLLQCVILLLDVRAVCSLAACNARMRGVASDEDLWRRLCERCFPHTDPRRWLTLEPQRERAFVRQSIDGLAPPSKPADYRCAVYGAV